MKYLLFSFLLGCSALTQAQNTIVKTANGSLEGTLNADKTIRIYKGIPFAAPPVRDLRWKAPQPAKNWTGVRKCTSFSASPVQNKPVPFMCWSEEFIAQPEPLSEDCLYLNVWTAGKSPSEKLPVFVWIYGGGLSSGSSNCAIYDGEEMAKKGVIFVSINYRVGVFGFMAHPELTKESGHTSSGNYGFLDQIAALKWIQQNITAFGGDPGNVTIAGQSAGSFSVNALVASPLAKGLFHRAIAESGGLLSDLLIQPLETAEKQGTMLMEKANTHSIAELRKKSADEILALGNDSKIGRFGTTLDNYVLPTNLRDYFSKEMHNEVPLLTGWVTGDGGLFGDSKMSADEYKKEAQSKYGDKADEFLAIFKGSTDEEVKASKSRLTMLQFAGMPSRIWAESNKKTKSYVYQFSHVPPDKPGFPNYGAFHTSEVPYALHTLHEWKRDWQPVDRDLENTMSSYWVNFAKTGDPNGNGLPEWKPYDVQTGYIMSLGDKVSIQEGLLKKEMDFLETARK